MVEGPRWYMNGTALFSFPFHPGIGPPPGWPPQGSGYEVRDERAHLTGNGACDINPGAMTVGANLDHQRASQVSSRPPGGSLALSQKGHKPAAGEKPTVPGNAPIPANDGAAARLRCLLASNLSPEV